MCQFNIKKHINKFIDRKIAVNCKTEELANEFLNYCSKLGIKWCTSEKLIGNNQWDRYKEETSYHHNQHGIEFASATFYEKESDYIIVEFTGLEDTYVHVKKPKPPLGVMPKEIHEFKRVQELCRALHEYSLYEDADLNLIIKWSEELNDRLYGLKGIKQIDNGDDDDWGNIL